MKNILVIDCEEGRRDFFRKITGDEFKVFLAKNAGQGMGGFTKLKPPIVILHSQSDGQQLAADIRNLEGGRDCCIVILGGEATPDVKTHVLPWPVEAEKLKESLRNICRKSTDTPEEKTSGKEETTPDLNLEFSTALALFSELGPTDIEYIGMERLVFVKKQYENLEHLDYYQVLGVPADENPALIKRSYFALARSYHPDHFASVAQGNFRQAAGQIFRRMTEAYQILMNAEKRAEYDRRISKDRNGETLRFSTGEREQKGPKVRDREIENPQARKFYNLAQSAIRDGDYAAAKMNLKLAAQMAGEHPLIKKSQEEIDLLLQK